MENKVKTDQNTKCLDIQQITLTTSILIMKRDDPYAPYR